MKLKDYLNSLVSRRKSNPTIKPSKFKAPQDSISATDCHYEICDSNDLKKFSNNDHPNRTETLLNRHAQLVNTIVNIQSQTNSCPQCRLLHQQGQQSILSNCHYSNTLSTCHIHQEYPYQSMISSSNNSLCIKTRQRSKIRTNPWIHTNFQSQSKQSSSNPPMITSGLIHSESFPQTLANGNTRLTNPTNRILHHSDSGHGFSLSSSRIIDSSSPDNTSNDGILLDDKHNAQYSSPQTIPSDQKRKNRKSSHSRYQRPSNLRVSSPKKSYSNRKHQIRNSSPRLINDHFSIQFEEIVENERLHKQQQQQQRSPMRQSPFILPLDEPYTNSSSSVPTLRSTNLKKSDSRTILKHIEEIENEIQLITNLNIEQEEQMLSSNDFTKEKSRHSIHEQIDQWIEQCLTIPQSNPTTRLHTECDLLSDTIKEYVTCICPNEKTKSTELMTAFYLSETTSPPKRTKSFVDQPLQIYQTQINDKDSKSIHECPF
ncbi:hypothetical protein I4U23_024545 [Adineta vaga]|nr:hypothetical protein I4U23_024545 [Adineta vaga]